MNHLEITQAWKHAELKTPHLRARKVLNEKACGCFEFECTVYNGFSAFCDTIIEPKICPKCITKYRVTEYKGPQEDFLDHVQSRSQHVWDKWTCGCVKVFEIESNQMSMYRCPECRSHDTEIQARCQALQDRCQALQDELNHARQELQTPLGVPYMEAVQAQVQDHMPRDIAHEVMAWL
jgi:hypothetical protein